MIHYSKSCTKLCYIPTYNTNKKQTLNMHYFLKLYIYILLAKKKNIWNPERYNIYITFSTKNQLDLFIELFSYQYTK